MQRSCISASNAPAEHPLQPGGTHSKPQLVTASCTFPDHPIVNMGAPFLTSSRVMVPVVRTAGTEDL